VYKWHLSRHIFFIFACHDFDDGRWLDAGFILKQVGRLGRRGIARLLGFRVCTWMGVVAESCRRGSQKRRHLNGVGASDHGEPGPGVNDETLRL
jgi:hypothetical protein